VTNAIAAVDLTDRSGWSWSPIRTPKVLVRRTFRCRAWDLGTALEWAASRAAAKGWDGATAACEPTGHRWRVLGQHAADRGMPFVCMEPMVTSWPVARST
jgi:transposase